MAKNSIRDYSATNSSNTDIQSIDISEGCSPAGINNAIREIMADLKDVSTGAVALESPAADSLTVTGDLTVDTNTLYVDSTSNNVGIGTSSPVASSLLTLKETNAGGDGAELRLINSSTTVESATQIVFTNTTTDSANSAVIKAVRTASGQDFRFSSDGSEAMRISSGNVGIGLSSNISSKLHVNTEMSIGADGDNRAIIGYTPSRFYIGTRQSGTNYFDTFNVSGGNVAINTTSPNTSYQTTIQANSTKGALSIDGPATNGYWAAEWDMPSGSTYGILFKNAGSNVGNVRINASSTSYNTSSDYRLKENVTADWDATTRLKQLNPVRFNFIADADTTVDGFLAHEVQDIVPEAISGTKDAMRDEEYEVTPAVEATYDDDGNVLTEAVPAVMGTRSVPDYQGIDQSKLVPLLVKTIQELEARITALEAN